MYEYMCVCVIYFCWKFMHFCARWTQYGNGKLGKNYFIHCTLNVLCK